MEQPNRNYTDGTYRYGFQGQEKDDELKGKGNSIDFGARIYDPRVGRWFKPDPIKKHQESTYSAFAGNPNIYLDPNGKDTLYVHSRKFIHQKTKTVIFSLTFSVVKNGVESQVLPELPKGATGIYWAVPIEFWRDGNIWYDENNPEEFPIRFESYTGPSGRKYKNSIRIKYINDQGKRVLAHKGSYIQDPYTKGCVTPTLICDRIKKGKRLKTGKDVLVGVESQKALDIVRELFDRYVKYETKIDKYGRTVEKPINGVDEFLMKTHSHSIQAISIEPNGVNSVSPENNFQNLSIIQK